MGRANRRLKRLSARDQLGRCNSGLHLNMKQTSPYQLGYTKPATRFTVAMVDTVGAMTEPDAYAKARALASQYDCRVSIRCWMGRGYVEIGDVSPNLALDF
jgi:hypothetical protein